MTVGLLGGTFDPPHRGHLALARAALASGHVQRVLLVPAHIPPHKVRNDITPANHRLAMTRLLAEADPRIDVTDIELTREGPSYTLDTVRQLQQNHPETAYRLVIGADMAVDFHTWREAETLARTAPPLIAERPGTPLPPPDNDKDPGDHSPALHHTLHAGRIRMDAQDISSTEIRQTLAAGLDVSDHIPPAVLAYIHQHHLYR